MSLITDTKTVVAPHPSESIPVFVLPSLTKATFLERFIPNTISTVRILRKIHPNLVHLHAEHQYGFAAIASGFPFVLNSWGMEVLELPTASFVRKALAKVAASRAAKIVVDARILKDIWITMGVPSEKIKVIPFGVNLNMFNPRVNGRSIRKRLQIGDKDVAIISTRPFYNDHYNIECLIKAIPLVLKESSNARFIIKGSGPREEYLRKLTKDLGISEYVHFVVGVLPHQEVARYLRAADIYVSTSFIDSTSVSLLEAMACGLAPVITDIAGNREWVQNGVNGLFFPRKDHETLAGKLLQIIENEHQRKQFGERCLKIVEERASWKKCASEFEAIYDEFIQ